MAVQGRAHATGTASSTSTGRTLAGPSGESAALAAVGCWNMEVVLLSLPGLAPVGSQLLGAEQVIPRSVLLAGFEAAHHHLLVGLGDGALHSWRLDADTGALTGEREHVAGGRLQVWGLGRGPRMGCECNSLAPVTKLVHLVL